MIPVGAIGGLVGGGVVSSGGTSKPIAIGWGKGKALPNAAHGGGIFKSKGSNKYCRTGGTVGTSSTTGSMSKGLPGGSTAG